MNIPTLTTARMRLRGFVPEDPAVFHHLLGEEGVLRYFPRSEPPNLERVEQMVDGILNHWEHHGYGLWAVEARDSGAFMGRCGLQLIETTGEVEIDFLLGRPFWGQGFATEAAKIALDFGFSTQYFPAVVGIVHPDNIASQRVLEKLGMSMLEKTRYFGMECLRYEIRRCV